MAAEQRGVCLPRAAPLVPVSDKTRARSGEGKLAMVAR